jgi:hypothetical protein
MLKTVFKFLFPYSFYNGKSLNAEDAESVSEMLETHTLKELQPFIYYKKTEGRRLAADKTMQTINIVTIVAFIITQVLIFTSL